MIVKDDTEEADQNRPINLSADLDEEVFEDNEVEGSNKKVEAHQVQGEESPAAVKVKVVRRLSFSSSRGEKDAKKLKISSSSARENKKATRKPPKSKSKKAGLVFSVSRAHNRLKQDRYATRVRVVLRIYLCNIVYYIGESECCCLHGGHPGVPCCRGFRTCRQLREVFEGFVLELRKYNFTEDTLYHSGNFSLCRFYHKKRVTPRHIQVNNFL